MMRWAGVDFYLMHSFVGSIVFHFRHLTGIAKELEETDAIVKIQTNTRWLCMKYSLKLAS